ERSVQGRCDAVLDDRPADRTQVVAHAAAERGLMRLHFFADAARDGSFVALAARVVVEQGAEPRRRGELGLKHAAAPLEQGALVEGQKPQGTARLARRNVERRRVGFGCGSGGRRLVASHDEGTEQQGAAVLGHEASRALAVRHDLAVSNRAGNRPQGGETGSRRKAVRPGRAPLYTPRRIGRVARAHVESGHMSGGRALKRSSRRRDSRMMSRNTATTADSASGPGFASTTSLSTARSRAGARSGNPAARFDRAIRRANRARKFSRRTSTWSK